jgi:hypothetical protein
MHRHARQMRLPEIGARGQTRIVGVRVDVAFEGLAAEVAVRYLAGAGIGRVRVRDERLAQVALAIDPSVLVEVDPTLSVAATLGAIDLRDPDARAVARGAHAALLAIRSALKAAP